MSKVKTTASILKWLARIISSLIFLLILVFIMGEGIPNLFKQPPGVQFEFAGLFIILIGLILGWKWPLTGGILILLGNMAFHIIEGRLYVGTVFAAFDLAGLLYIASRLLSKIAEKFDEA
jgi:uncharacterized integral membrane protein